MGWFGRMMTFEVIADELAPTIGSILADASRGAIASGAGDQVAGFAAYGASIRSAVEPLVECFGVELFDDGIQLGSPVSAGPIAISSDELGCVADGKQVSRMERSQRSARELPGVLRLTYYDPARDYQTGEARAVAAEGAATETREDLPAVLDAAAAKATAHAMIGRTWSERDRLTLRLSPRYVALEPGSRIELELTPSVWVAAKTTLDGFVMIAELRPSTAPKGTIAGDAGRIADNPDDVAQPLSLALIDAQSHFGLTSNNPVVLLAATSSSGWQRQPVELSFGGQSLSVDVARGKSVIGRSETALPPAGANLIDHQNSVIVQLIDEDQWLASCDDDALAVRENLAVLGGELIQFGRAVALGGGRFQLSRLLRGRGGSEWACTEHSSNEQFCLLKAGTIQPVALPNWAVGATLSAAARGGTPAAIIYLGENLRPPAPVKLSGDLIDTGDLVLSWTRRSWPGFAWVDGIDVPLGETREEYRVNLAGAAGSTELNVTTQSVTIGAADLASLGTGALTVEVRQIGDAGASRPAELSLTIS